MLGESQRPYSRFAHAKNVPSYEMLRSYKNRGLKCFLCFVFFFVCVWTQITFCYDISIILWIITLKVMRDCIWIIRLYGTCNCIVNYVDIEGICSVVLWVLTALSATQTKLHSGLMLPITTRGLRHVVSHDCIVHTALHAVPCAWSNYLHVSDTLHAFARPCDLLSLPFVLATLHVGVCGSILALCMAWCFVHNLIKWEATKAPLWTRLSILIRPWFRGRSWAGWR